MNILGAYGDFKQERKIGEYTIYLPDPPNIRTIDNRDLPLTQQKWHRRGLNLNTSKGMKTFLAMPKKERMQFVKDEWARRKGGYWWFNGGNLEHATGTHWMYMEHWYLENTYPNFIDRDRDFFHLWKYGVEDDGDCTGLQLIGKRRDGKTHRGNIIVYDRSSMARQAMGGMQSKTDGDVKKVFNKLIRQWKRLPFYFKPVDEGDDHPKSALRFYPPKKIDRKGDQRFREYTDALESEINYESVTDEAYDGMKLIVYFSDEYGKCLAKDTPVLMHSGSIKMVQDVKAGELLMGNDSTPRLVKSLARGQEMMYDIVPNKGMSWGCNESHILSLKIVSSSPFGKKLCKSMGVDKLSKGDVLNITVKDYLSLNANQKRHLVLYKVPVEYAEREHVIDPYILGVWLGDGAQASSSICIVDPEIMAAVNTFCRNNFFFLNQTADPISYYISKGISVTNKKNGQFVANGSFRSMLRNENLLHNKHIPHSYLIDSRKNRLQLLAGLLDTDGYKIVSTTDRAGYEIIQKRKELAYQIQTLAASLGFYASIYEKTATMKREDGSVYRCQVYRVSIYGDIELIPLKVKRKQAAVVEKHHINRRNPLHTGFKVVKKEVGDYYGFSITGNRLFLLGDYTVTHNTKSGNVHARSQVTNECMVVGTNVVGKQIWTTTVEEMVKKGGVNAKLVWDESDPNNHTQNGRTINGMKRLFVPASVGMEGLDPLDKKPFVNEFGYSQIAKAEAYIMREYNSRKGETKRSFRRKYPLKITDAFLVESDGGHFDDDKIDEQLEYLTTWTGKLRHGSLEWSAGFGSKPYWKDGAQETSLFHSLILMDNEKYGASGQFAKNIDDEWVPMNTKNVVAGCDPFDHKNTAENKKSNAAAYFFIRFNPADPLNTGLIAMEYHGRRKTPNQFYEDMLKACLYFGCQINPENTKSGIINYFDDKGYGNFIMKRPDSAIDPNARGRGAETDGTPSNTTFVINAHLSSMIEYVDSYTKLIFFKELLEELLRFNVNERTVYDRVMAFGYTLLAALAKKNFVHEENLLPAGDYFEEINSDYSEGLDYTSSSSWGDY